MLPKWLQQSQYFHHAHRTTYLSLRRPWLLFSVLLICFFGSLLILFPSPYERVKKLSTGKPGQIPDIYRNEPDQPGFYDWQTRSRFNPVRISNAQDQSIDQLCDSFPQDLLDEIQPVLKTGHGVMDVRVRPHLQGASACLHNLLIFSDKAETYEGREIIDVIETIPDDLSGNMKQLEAWRNGSLADGTASRKAAWGADKFKFISSVTMAYKMRPGRKWYVFYEADTYVVWDNVFRVLDQYDPDESWYFGSPTQGMEKTWFANGGPGYILSREAMRRLTEDDYDQSTGEFKGQTVLRAYWKALVSDCCGDSILGWALWGHNVTLSGMWPMMNPHPPHGVPFQDRQWCQPLMTMHKPLEEDLLGLWRWQFENRVTDRPLLYRDLAISYFNMANLTTKGDWNNAGWDGFGPPVPSKFYDHDPHASFDACGDACKAHSECFQYTYHLKKCTFVRSFRMGKTEEPGFSKEYSKNHPKEKESDWDAEDLRYMAGWDPVMIQKWMDERPCEEVLWPKPSTKRIF